MKAAFSGVKALAAMIRSPSFSRCGLSSTMTNLPAPGRGGVLVVRTLGDGVHGDERHEGSVAVLGGWRPWRGRESER